MSLKVSSEFLSDPFQINIFSTVTVRGKIIDVIPVSKIAKTMTNVVELKGREVKFDLFVGALTGMDTLHFFEESWNMIRDYGILQEHFNLRVELDSYSYSEGGNTQTVSIYQKQKIEI